MTTCEHQYIQYDFVFAPVLRVYHGDSLLDAGAFEALPNIR